MIPEIVVRLVGYEVECDKCGLIDTSPYKREANKIKENHENFHKLKENCKSCEEEGTIKK